MTSRTSHGSCAHTTKSVELHSASIRAAHLSCLRLLTSRHSLFCCPSSVSPFRTASFTQLLALWVPSRLSVVLGVVRFLAAVRFECAAAFPSRCPDPLLSSTSRLSVVGLVQLKTAHSTESNEDKKKLIEQVRQLKDAK